MAMMTNNTLPKLRAALTGPMNQKQLAATAGVSSSSTSRGLTVMLLGVPREAHISGWEQGAAGGSTPVAIFSPGPGADAQCTVRPLTEKERARRFVTAGPAQEFEQQVRRSRASGQPIPRPHPLMSIFGMVP